MVTRKHTFLILVLQGRVDYPAFVAGRPAHEVERLKMVQINRTSSCHTSDPFTDKGRCMTLPYSDYRQCYLIFNVFKGKELTD